MGGWGSGVLERAVGPGGPASLVAGPYGPKNTVQEAFFPSKQWNFQFVPYWILAFFRFSGQGSPEAAFGPGTAKLRFGRLL